jgi:Protein of unknown function (DUF3592)
MRPARDRDLPEPYRSWIDRSRPLPACVYLLPVTTNAWLKFGLFVVISALFGMMFGLTVLMLSELNLRDVPWSAVAFLAVFVSIILLPPFLCMANWIRAARNGIALRKGTLRLGILVGPPGVLVRIRPNRCFPIPAGRFIGALTRTDYGGRTPTHYFRIETHDGPVEFHDEDVASSAELLNVQAGECWGRSIPAPDSAEAQALMDGTAERTPRIVAFLRRGIAGIGQLVGLGVLLAAASYVPPAVSYVADAARMRGWETVEATVLQVQAKKPVRGSETEYAVEYRYRYRDAEYQGTRLDVRDRPDTFGPFQKDLADELSRHQKDGSPVTVYVNPADPAESVLDRRLRPTVLAERLAVPLVLTLLGGTFLIAFVAYAWADVRRRQLKERYPSEPWMWRKDWASKRILAGTVRTTWILWAVAAFYFLVVLPLGYAIVYEWGRTVWSIPSGVLILGAWVMVRLIWLNWKNRGFSRAELRLGTLPGVLGGPFAGVVLLRSRFPDGTAFRVQLSCVRIIYRRESGDPEEVLWSDTVTVDKPLAADEPNTTAIPVYFAVPYDARPTDPGEARQIRWRLKVSREGGNVGHHSQFEVPVFRTAESSRDYREERGVLERHAVTIDPESVLAKSRCRVEPLPDGERFHFTYFRLDAFLVGLVLSIGSAVGVWAVFYFGAPWLVALFPGAVLVGFIWVVSEMLLWGCYLEIGKSGVTVTSGYAGRRKSRTLPLKAVAGLECEPELQMRDVTWYRVQLRATDGEQFTLVRRLDGRQEAEAVAAWLSGRLGIPRVADDC